MKKYYVIALALCVLTSVPQAVLAVTSITPSGVLMYTNAQRYKAGLPLLVTDQTLSELALAKMKDLFAKQYFAHESPSGKTVSDLAKNAGYTFLAVGENLAMGDFYSNKHVVDSWMNSPGHRANILSEKFSEIGIAAGLGMYNGRYTWMIVQSFGLPRSSCPELDSVTKAKIDSLDKRLALLGSVLETLKKRAEERGISRTEYNRRAEAYNTIVAAYNTSAKEQKRLVETYNDKVDSFNHCLDTKLATGSTVSH